MSEFEKEDRFIVIKRRDLDKCQQNAINTLNYALRLLNLPSREYVVVESDWPEYEIVWKMIQDRVEGRQNELASLRAQLEAVNAKLAEAEQERDQLAEQVEAAVEDYTNERSKVKRLVEALKPLAALNQEHNARKSDDHPLIGINSAIITCGDVRLASALLAELGG